MWELKEDNLQQCFVAFSAHKPDFWEFVLISQWLDQPKKLF